MLKKSLLVLLVALLTPFGMKAEWIPLDRNKPTKTPPKVTLLSNNSQSTIIRVDLSGFDLEELRSGGKTYQALDLLSEIVTTEPGRPELPYIAKILAIPDQASVTVEVLETGDITIFKDIDIVPARASWHEGSPEPLYMENRDVYRSDNFYPREIARVEPPAVFRDFRIARVSVYPVRYNPAKKELQLTSSITVKINYGQGKVVNPRTASNKAIVPSFGKIYRSFIFNYPDVLNNLYGGREDGREVMLCIMPDEFVESFQIYADWKRQIGTDIHITKFSDIGANGNNPDIVKNHITDAYINWEYPPTYVLIIGDDGVFPKKIVTYPDYSFPSEDYFVSLDGNDYFPEMMIGRFTNQGDYRMRVMIHKYMLYEKTPNTESTDWFKHGIVCSNNDYESQVSTKRFTANVMLEDGGFTSVDTLMSDGSGWGGNCSMDLDDVIDAINEGRSYLNYRGEGWWDGWHASCYNFGTQDVASLSNGERFTFVTSIGCGVTMFDTWSANNCFGEEWIEGGSLTNTRGGVAFVGPTSNTHTTYNNKIDKGIYVGMFREGMDTPGEALLRGKLYMYNVFGDEYYVGYHYKVYCILGDPSIHIWKDVPLTVNVDYPESILVGPNHVEVEVTFASSGNPVENAQVCLTNDEIFVTGYCDALGKVILDFIPENPETLTITVRGGNVYPYQGEIDISQPAQLVEPVSDPVIVDLDGNMDGLENPNENCTVTYTLRNWGSQTASNVLATLVSSDEDLIQVTTTNPVSFGNLAAGAGFTGDPFNIYIKPNCPVGQIVPLYLHVTSSSNEWDYNYDSEINGCDLIVDNFMVNDAGSPEPNYRMDPGETVMLFVSVKNQGNDAAPDVVGKLKSNDPYINIEDSIGSYGTFNIEEIRLNSVNYYVVHIDEACPTEYLAEFSLQLTTSNGNYPYMSTPIFSIPVSLPVPSDYTGPDAYGYYAYSSDDYFDQAPVYNWFEIDELGNQLNNEELGDYTETVNLPFTFKYYGIDYNQLRISTDGWIAFGSGNQTASINTELPHNDNINCMVAGFWDDLYDSETVEGHIYYYNDLANHRFIVEWDSIARNDLGSEPSVEIFQAVLYDPDFYPTMTGDGEIIFNYKKIEAPESSTIGIENHTQNVGLQYLFNNDYNPTASPIMNGFALKFTTEPPFASIITSLDEGSQDLSSNGYILDQNHPNPFRSQTWITYVLPEPGNVSLTVYDQSGRLVCTLYNGKQATGSYTFTWKGKNDAGNQVSSGIYFYQLKTEGFEKTRKMFILK